MLQVEMDHQGNVIQGNIETLRRAAFQGQKLTIGLHTGPQQDVEYEEMLPCQSVIIDGKDVIGIVPYQTCSVANDSSLEALQFFAEPSNNRPVRPYGTHLLYTTQCLHGIFRFTHPNVNWDESWWGAPDFILSCMPGPSTKNQYRRYRWFSDNTKWNPIFRSGVDGVDKKYQLLDLLRNGNSLKVKFDLGGYTYILEPNITFLGDPKKDKKNRLISIRTLPTIIWDKHNELVQYNNRPVILGAEFTVSTNSMISMISLIQFVEGKGFNCRTLHFTFNVNVTWLIRE